MLKTGALPLGDMVAVAKAVHCCVTTHTEATACTFIPVTDMANEI